MIAALDDEDPWVGAACTSLVAAGGKHLRASLLVHCARVCGTHLGSRVLDGAAAVEMVHLGTLVHDDIVDRSATRRGVVALHEQWGNWTASLVGARMFLQAALTLFELAPTMRARFFALVVELCQGQLRDVLNGGMRAAGNEEAVRRYLHTAHGKTGDLFGFSCELGAALGNAGEARQRLAARWGLRFGILYQVVDDILDLFGDERLLGKLAGSDLCEGRRTFPWIIAGLDPEEYRVQALMDRDAAQAAARRRMIEAGGLAAAERFARALARETELARVSFEGDAPSTLREVSVALMRKLDRACELGAEIARPVDRCAEYGVDLPALLCELDERPRIEADFRRPQVMAFMSKHAPELLMPALWSASETASTALTVRLAVETTRAFGGVDHDVSETGRWCALAVETLGGLQGVEHAQDCDRLLAADAALVVATGHVLALDFDSACDLLRGMILAIRQALRAASSGLPFGGPAIQPSKVQLQPLMAAVARVAARSAGASLAESRAIGEHWVLLAQLSTQADAAVLLTPTLLGQMHRRIESMSLSEPTALLASLSELGTCAPA